MGFTVKALQECKATRMSILLSSAAGGGTPADGARLDMLMSKVDSKVAQQAQAWSELAQDFVKMARLSVQTILTLVFSDIEFVPFYPVA